MPRETGGVRPGTLVLLILRVLRAGPLHGYAIAQRIHALSKQALEIEEGSLYPALQKLLLKGWVKGSWTLSESGRRVRSYRLTRAGRAQLEVEVEDFERVTEAIREVLRAT